MIKTLLTGVAGATGVEYTSELTTAVTGNEIPPTGNETIDLVLKVVIALATVVGVFRNKKSKNKENESIKKY